MGTVRDKKDFCDPGSFNVTPELIKKLLKKDRTTGSSIGYIRHCKKTLTR